MPPDIKIGAFVLGAILVLIGILGGNFELFGAKVVPKVSNPFLRFLAFALGAIFLVVSMYPTDSGSMPPPPTSPPIQPSTSHPHPTYPSAPPSGSISPEFPSVQPSSPDLPRKTNPPKTTTPPSPSVLEPSSSFSPPPNWCEDPTISDEDKNRLDCPGF